MDVGERHALPDVIGTAPNAQLEVRMLAILPNVFTEADYDAGYRYELSLPQAEFSLTPWLDRAGSGRCLLGRSSGAPLTLAAPIGVCFIVPRKIIVLRR